MEIKISLIILLMAFWVLILHPNSAHAYLDPGTGSMIIQAAIAVILAVSVSIGFYWRRLKSFLNRLFSHNKKEDHDSGVN